MTASWAWVVGPWNGGPQHELTRAKSRKATFNLVSPSTASCTLNGRDPQAEWIEELVTDLHLLRRPAPGQPAQRLYRGRVGPTGDDVDADSHSVSVSTADYRELLGRRQLGPGSPLTWTQAEPRAIVAGLVTDVQTRPGGGGNLSMTVDGPSGGVLRDRVYEPGDKVGDLIQKLSDVIGGFDWEILTPTAGELVLMMWSPQRGQDRGVVLELGGLVASASRKVDPASYANAIRVTGKPPEGGGAEPAPVQLDTGDLATRPEGRWEATFGEDITTDAALAERAAWRLEEAQAVRPSYTVKLRRGAWRGPDHIWLGDPVRLVLMSGRLRVDTVLRVQTVDVGLGEDGAEDVSLTVGSPKRTFGDRIAATEKRLADLERR